MHKEKIVYRLPADEVELSLHEVVRLGKNLESVFGVNGSAHRIPITKIRSQLTGTYQNGTGELRCEFNTDGIKELLGNKYEVYTKPRRTPTGLRYYLLIELKEGKKQNA